MTDGASSKPDARDSHTAQQADAGAAREELLAVVLNELAEQMRTGGAADLSAACRAHPELAGELRSLWGAMMVADCLASDMTHADSSAARERASAAEAAIAKAEKPATSPPSRQTATSTTGQMFGPYELLEELGRGGMGVVYKARHRELDRVVALKMIRHGASAPASELVRFRQEAQAAARLDNPHLVRVFEVGEQDGQPYFTMQFVEGETLAQRLAEGPLPPREAAALLLPVVEAIQAAHEQGVLHRDLKPSNILIDRQGRALVTDFGLAKRVEGDSSLTNTGAILGTPTFMSPEQAAGSRGRVGPASDVYSLGAILYQTLTGRPPFQGSSPMETVLLVLEQEPLPPRLINPKADRVLELVALKCLQKPAELRYPSAAALADDLRAFLADEPIAARSGQFSQVLARWMRETHHATVLEHWGLLWMWHSLALVLLSVATNWLQWRGVGAPWPYVLLWTAGLGTWAAMFWALRRRAGPVTFIERQIAHVWAGSVLTIALLFPVEMLLGLPVLSLSPILGLTSGMVFLVKAGMLSGAFYIQSLALFVTSLAMALMQRWNIPFGITLFGVVSGACFFFPGLKYYRQRREG
ncbi:MAG: serine/threonine protein kinase [Planctomycetes bacterium]|nr:serine/threonine protein kinase [Planctomycetota bacterium]